MNQKNLDVSVADWMAQKGYPQDQIDRAMATFKGAFSGVPTSQSTEGIEPTTPVATTSTAQNIGSGLVGLAALVKQLGITF